MTVELNEELVRTIIGPSLQIAYQCSPSAEASRRFNDGVSDAFIVKKVTRFCQHYFDSHTGFWLQSVRSALKPQFNERAESGLIATAKPRNRNGA